ncbi:plasmid recombination protein, partial [Dysgonomonas sp. 25]
MGYVVLHMQKAKGSGGDSGMSKHIERDRIPENADEERTHLN